MIPDRVIDFFSEIEECKTSTKAY